MTKQIFQSKEMEEFEKDSRWFYENIDLLRKRNFTEKFVAVKNKEIITSDNNLETVIRFVEQKGENPSYIVIEFVYPEGTVILL